MGILSSASATSKVNNYKHRIDGMKNSARNNFEDMDLENNKVCDDIEKIVEEIEQKCNDAAVTLGNLSFE
jgi:hypothetical protein